MFYGAYLKPPLNFSVISIGTEARLESKKGEGGSSLVQRYNKFPKVPNIIEEKTNLVISLKVLLPLLRWEFLDYLLSVSPI